MPKRGKTFFFALLWSEDLTPSWIWRWETIVPITPPHVMWPAQPTHKQSGLHFPTCPGIWASTALLPLFTPHPPPRQRSVPLIVSEIAKQAEWRQMWEGGVSVVCSLWPDAFVVCGLCWGCMGPRTIDLIQAAICVKLEHGSTVVLDLLRESAARGSHQATRCFSTKPLQILA